MALDLSALQKAITFLEQAVKYAKNLPAGIDEDIVRDSVIQRFKYTYELSWKIMQRWVKHNVSPEDADPRTKKDLFRLMAKKQMIDDPMAWFAFAEARNNTVHTYNLESAQNVYQTALQFLQAVKAFFKQLERHND